MNARYVSFANAIGQKLSWLIAVVGTLCDTSPGRRDARAADGGLEAAGDPP
jgi:hypothetical protein